MLKWTRFNIVSVVLGFAFLYLPIVLLVVYSFNESKLVTVWGGFSTRWYSSLLNNQALLDAAWVTIRVGLLSATLATILGTMAALTMVGGDSFQALGIRLLRGRLFTEADRTDSPLVAIVNHKLAEHYWPGQDPIGKRLRRGMPETATPWLTVVGIHRRVDWPTLVERLVAVGKGDAKPVVE